MFSRAFGSAKTFSCSSCSKEFSNAVSLRHHRYDSHGSMRCIIGGERVVIAASEGGWVCEVEDCLYAVKTRKSFRMHMKREHDADGKCYVYHCDPMLSLV